MIYEKLSTLTREEAEMALSANDPKTISVTLLQLALHDSDWQWVASQCALFSEHPNSLVRGNVATAIGHLARIHKQMDQEMILLILRKLLLDPTTRGKADDALDDISTFLKIDKEKLLA